MFHIRLKNGDTFHTSNEEVANAIECTLYYCGEAFTQYDYDDLSDEAKEIFNRYATWNALYYSDLFDNEGIKCEELLKEQRKSCDEKYDTFEEWLEAYEYKRFEPEEN